VGPLTGTTIRVEVLTHVTGTIEFASGAIATLTMSWDTWASTVPHLEFHGTEGSITGPDPDYYDGSVRILRGADAEWDYGDGWRTLRAGESDWTEIELTHDDTVLRGIGVADMAYAIRTGRPHRASGEMALHALEIMLAFERSALEGTHVTLATTCAQPAALPAHLPHGVLDTLGGVK
jgi:predicted dehydrogenase